jgi:hypothetical protein
MLFAFKTLKEKYIQMKQQKTKQQSFQELEIEKNKLYVSKQNPTRLKEIIKKLDYFYYGIK